MKSVIHLSLILIVALLVLSACHTKPATEVVQTIVTHDTIVYEMKTLKKSAGPCRDSADMCATVEFDYPVFSNDSFGLNAWVSKQMGEGYLDTLHHDNFGDVMQQFLDNYALTTKSFPDQTERWRYQKIITVKKQADDAVDFHIYIFEFAGGPHPNQSNDDYHYDLKKKMVS